MNLGEIRIHCARLGYGHAKQLGQLYGFVHRLADVDFIADQHQRHSGLDEQLRGTLDLGGIGPDAHAGVDFFLRDDLRADLLIIEIRMPRGVSRPVGRRPRCLERAAYRLGNHVRVPGEPGIFGDRLNDLLLVGDLFETISAGAPGLIGTVAVENERRLLFEGVEHLPHGVH
jgi:hypothetical protein